MISVNEVEIALFKAADALRGVADARLYGQWMLALLFIKYATDALPEDPLEKPARFVVPDAARFDYLALRSDEPDNAARLDQALAQLTAANSEVGDLFAGVKFNSGAFAGTPAQDRALQQVLLQLHSPHLDLSPERLQAGVGALALEQLATNFLFESHSYAGELYSPRAIAKLMVELVAPKPRDSIHDPACGSAGFLVTAANYLKEHYGDSGECELSGQEINHSAYAMSTMNLLLHGFEHGRIKHGNSLRNPKFVRDGRLERFDVVLANPPFSLSEWGWEEANEDPFGRFAKYGLPPRSRGDFAFILHMIASMKPDNGRMAVIVPHGVLFRGGSEALIRRNLIEANLLDAVIGLPPKLFYNTGIPTAILVFRAKRSRQDVFFVDASGDFALNRKINELRVEDVQRITTACHERREDPGYARAVSREEIAANDHSISIARYVSAAQPPNEVNLAQLMQRQRELEQQLTTVRRAIDELWERLSFDK
jgi:type I restriction enzyme M protein